MNLFCVLLLPCRPTSQRVFLSGEAGEQLSSLLLDFTSTKVRRWDAGHMKELLAAAKAASKGIYHLLQSYGEEIKCQPCDRRLLRALAKSSSLAGFVTLPAVSVPVLRKLSKPDAPELSTLATELKQLSMACPALVKCILERESLGNAALLRPLLREIAAKLSYSLGPPQRQTAAPLQHPVTEEEGKHRPPLLGSFFLSHVLMLLLRLHSSDQLC